MSDERKKVLEMVADGKINVDEAERLLKALGEDNSPSPEDKSTGEEWSAQTARQFDDLENQIRSGVDEVRRTVQASMPRLKNVIREAAPDVERIVEEATSSIPGMVDEVSRAIRDALGSVRDVGDDEFPARVERQFSEEAPIQPESELELRNPRGHIEVVTWEEEKFQADVHLTVKSRDEEMAQSCADAVQLVQEPGDGRLTLRPVFPKGKEDASYRLDILLHVPSRLRLNLHTSHGDLVVPEMESDVVLSGHHGKLQLEGTAGDAGIDHHHGGVVLGRIGGKLALNAHHAGVTADEVVQEAKVNAHHGGITLRRIGGNLALNSHHSPLETEEVHGTAVINSHHSPISLRQVLSDVTVNSHHGGIEIDDIGGSLRLASNHGGVCIGQVSGDLSARNSHAGLTVESVGRSAVLHTAHSGAELNSVKGDITAECDRGALTLGRAGGRVTIRANRGEVRVQDPAGEVMIENNRAAITVTSNEPVTSAYTLSNTRGDVTLVLPDGSDLAVQGFVRKGNIDTDLPLAVSANGQQGQSVNGTLGQGGAKLQAEVDTGRLSLRAG